MNGAMVPNQQGDTGQDSIVIGWEKLGNLSALEPTRDAFKAKYIQAYPTEKPVALPVKAGVLFRFAVDIEVGD